MRGHAAAAAGAAVDEPTPLGRVVSYLLLGFWAFVVLFPLYWVVDHLVQAADRRQ